jgi:DNA-binding MarR family transcriptional regulator
MRKNMPNPQEKQQKTTLSIINLQRALNNAMKQTSLQEGVTLQQATILRILQHEGTVPMSKIAEHLQVSRPNITGIIDRLEKKGLIEKSENNQDRRSTTIKITMKGQELQEKISQNYATLIKTGLKTLSATQQETLVNNLTKFIEEITKK